MYVKAYQKGFYLNFSFYHQLTKFTIYILVIFLSLSCTTTRKRLEVITWSNKLLQYKDFKGQCGQSHYTGFCFSMLSIQSYQYYKSKPIVAAIFIPRKSWLLNYSEELITHEQYHFNITELYARVFRKIVAENKIDSLLNTVSKDSLIFKDYKDGGFLKAYIIIQKQLSKLQSIYDEQTSHSLNRIAQNEWQLHIDELLRLHQEYYKEYPDSLFYIYGGKSKNYK